MATIHVTLNRIDDRADTGSTVPVASSAPVAVQTMTSSGTSAPSTIVADAADGRFWEVTAKGGDVWVKFGTGTPVAASGDGHLVLAGQTRAWSVAANGEKIAVKDA